MLEKFVVREGDVVVAIKFDARKDIMVVGGFSQFRVFIKNILLDYFDRRARDLDIIECGVNKIRYNFMINKPKFDSGIEKLKAHEFEVEQVRSLERIMR